MTRFSIPDSAGGGGTTSTLSIYVNGVFHKNITLNSKYAWLYGAETAPGNSPGSGAPRHIYDEANIMLNSTVNAGATIRLQRDSGQGIATIDFVNLEQVAPIANPDPTRYVVPAGTAHQDVQNALDTARQDTTKLGVYLPAGTYPTSNKFTVYGRGIQVIGAGPWYTRFETPQDPGEHQRRLRRPVQRQRIHVQEPVLLGQLHVPSGRPGQSLGRAEGRRQPDHRQHLGRAHHLRLLGGAASPV